MTPRKIDHGWQPHNEQEMGSKTEAWERKRKPGKVQVGIDWSTTGVQKPISKPDSHPHPPNLMCLEPV